MSSTQAGPCSRPLRTRRSRALVLPPVPLAIDEQAEPLFEAQLLQVGALLLLAESFSHSLEPQSAKFLDGWLCQHESSFRSLQGAQVARVEVVRAAQIGVIQRRFGSRRGLGFRAVQIMLKDRFQAWIGAGVERTARRAAASTRCLGYWSPSRKIPRQER